MRRLPTRRLLFFAAGVFLGVALVVGWLMVRGRRRVATGQLQISLWYWRQPFRIAATDAPFLREMRVNTLFVRAGTITRDADSGALRLVMPQTWAAPPPTGIGIHLVFNADYGVVRHLDGVSDAALLTAFSEAIRTERARAVRAGIPVVGIQLDFDWPTRLLPRYATLLTALRADLRAMGAGRDALSITALPTWLTSRDMNAVADRVDFFVPQFYESVIPQTFGTGTDFATIGDEARLKRGIERAGRMHGTFWAGLPSYGHALVYDGKGRLRGTFHDAGVLDMLRQPYFRLAGVAPGRVGGGVAVDAAHFSGEDVVDVEPNGRGVRDLTNFHLIYDLPTPTLVARQVAIVRANRPANCRGIILFRYPEADATQSLPLPSLQSVLAGRTPLPHLKVLVWSRPIAPWRMIEGAPPEPDGATRNLFVTATNDGDGAAGVSADAVDVVVRFDHPCLRGSELASGGFDSVTPFVGAPTSRSSIARAEGVRLESLHLAPGESRTAGPFLVSADGRVIGGNWRVTGDGGFVAKQGQFALAQSNQGK